MHPGRAPQPATPVNFDMPAGACDCHVHIVGPPDRFPMVAKRLYTPPPALPEELAAMHRSCHFERVVVVTPSFYGSDNHATHYGMAAFPGAARGVAVIDENTPEKELKNCGPAACAASGSGLRWRLSPIRGRRKSS
jgi:predicted TIM-barrel fold metal-dependent hydrolase